MPEDRGQQKQNISDGDVNIDTKPTEVSEENESNLDTFKGDMQEDAQTETAKSQQKKLQHSDHHSIAYS